MVKYSPHCISVAASPCSQRCCEVTRVSVYPFPNRAPQEYTPAPSCLLQLLSLLPTLTTSWPSLIPPELWVPVYTALLFPSAGPQPCSGTGLSMMHYGSLLRATHWAGVGRRGAEELLDSWGEVDLGKTLKGSSAFLILTLNCHR